MPETIETIEKACYTCLYQERRYCDIPCHRCICRENWETKAVSTPQEPEKWTDPASLLTKEKFDELRQKLADIPDSEFDITMPQEPGKWSYPTRLEVYGLTPQEHDSMLSEQKGVCAICGLPETAKSGFDGVRPLCIDHCHETGKFRGLLCSVCNSGIGMFRDDIEVMASAISYLRNAELLKRDAETEPDLQQFTPEQIEEYCEKIESKGEYHVSQNVHKAVQIIRQLQQHVRAVSHIAEALAKNLPDDKRISLNRFRVQELVAILQLESSEAGMVKICPQS